MLDVSELPLPEQELYYAAKNYAGIEYDKHTLDQRLILTKAHDLLLHHIFNLFADFTLAFNGLTDDKIAKMEMQERLLWFLQDFPREHKYINECCAIDNDETLDNEGRDKAHKSLDDSKPIKPFSLESWIDFQDNVVWPIQVELARKQAQNKPR